MATSNMDTRPTPQPPTPPPTRQVSTEQVRLVVHVAHDGRHDVGLAVGGGNGEDNAAIYRSHHLPSLTTLHVMALHTPARARREQPTTALHARAVVVEQTPHRVGVVVDDAHSILHTAPSPLRLALHLVEQPVAVPRLLVHLAHRAVQEHCGGAGGLDAVQLDRPVRSPRRYGVHGGQPGGGERERGLGGIDDL